MKIKNVYDVATRRLCVGCGACVEFCPNGYVKMVDVENDGIRPYVKVAKCEECGKCLKACPGIKTPPRIQWPLTGNKQDEKAMIHWGPFIEIWEGYAADPHVRFSGASGGLCTALSLFCLENKTAQGILHTHSSPEIPWKNQSVYTTRKKDLVQRTGSRYSPASPCDGLKKIESSISSVFVGKPCDIAGLRLAQCLRPKLKSKTALSIGFFCAGTPSTRATLALFEKYAVNSQDVESLRNRGMGWPGSTTITFKGKKKQSVRISYDDSWGFLCKFRPFRCYLCADLSAEFADISVGDPWYRKVGEEQQGRSIVIVRNEIGRNIFHSAIKSGYIVAKRAGPNIIYNSQENLLKKRKSIWGRILIMKMLGIPCPELKGYHLYKNWKSLTLIQRANSIIGTAKRIFLRNYFKPQGFQS